MENVIKKAYKKIPLKKEKKVLIKNATYTLLYPLIKNTNMYKVWSISEDRLQSKPLSSNDVNMLFSKGLYSLKNNGIKATSKKIKSYLSKNNNLNSNLNNTINSKIESIKYSDVNIEIEQPGKIALHLHLFYIDLSDEFCNYFDNIPFEFDLFITIIDEGFKNVIEKKFSKIKKINKLTIIHVENRGRDIAPFLSIEDILNYNYVCHVHSKKSLYTGSEQVGWRKWLLDGLMGSEEQVRRIFSIFASRSDVGMIYPETYPEIPYWGHTWLKNKQGGRELFNRLNVTFDVNKSYIDYPAGSMFWAKVDAIKPLLDLKLKAADFPEENKQTDGTIAHIIERSFVEISRSQNYLISTIDIKANTFYIGKGNKNLYQYWNKSKNEIINIVDNFDTVSFDIFDTLLVRKIINPEDIFEIIEIELKNKLGLNIPFKRWRQDSEYKWRLINEFKLDCNINDIYNQMEKEYKLEKELCEKIKDYEINTELKFVTPRVDMVEILNYCIRKSKKVILTSDMYLTSSEIDKILKRIGVKNYNSIVVSNEINARKDNGRIWQLYKEQYKDSSLIHIGDNEHSDIQEACDVQIPHYHIMSSYNLFELSGMMDKFDSNKFNIADKVYTGAIVSKLFNSPFVLNDNKGKIELNDLKSLGYVMFGPIILNYMIWVLNESLTNGINQIAFLARDGYLLNQLFDLLKKSNSKLEEIEAHYLLASRRALSIISATCKDDLVNLLNTNYNGSICNLFYSRFGIEIDNDSNICLPEQIEKAKTLLEDYYEEILKNAENERNNYTKYLNNIGINLNGEIMISDVGYSGTIQYYLSKYLKKGLNGYYFITNEGNSPLKILGNKVNGLYGENQDYLKTNVDIYKYHLILESVLTAPIGQFIKIDNNLNPIYLNEERLDTNFINEIQGGIIEFVQDIINTLGDSILEYKPSNEVVEKIFTYFIEEKASISEELKYKFLVEDNYCSNSSISVFDYYYKFFNF